MRHMSDNSVALLVQEISDEISRDAKGWFFTQRAASRLCGMDRKTIRSGLQVDGPGWTGGFSTSKLLRSLAAQGISPGGIEEFKQQWRDGRITDLLVSCLITYGALTKDGFNDPSNAAVRSLHGVLTAGGLRGFLDEAFGVEDVGGRVTARLNGIGTRILYSRSQAEKKKNIGAYTAVVTNAITGHTPKAWNSTILPGQFGEKAGRIRDHADETTIDLIEAAERGMRGSNVDLGQATRFAQGLRELAERTLGYTGPELSPAKLTPRVTRQIDDGKRLPLADPTGVMPLVEDGRKRKELSASEEV